MRTIPDPGFRGDDGSASAQLRAALAAYHRGAPEGYLSVLSVLQRERLLVPVVTRLGEVEQDERGLARDKTSDLATVLMRGRDGRLALLAFSGTDSLARWRADARPVPTSASRVAEAALADGAVAVVVDVAGPVLFVIERADLRALADGFTLSSAAGQPVWAKAAD